MSGCQQASSGWCYFICCCCHRRLSVEKELLIFPTSTLPFATAYSLPLHVLAHIHRHLSLNLLSIQPRSLPWEKLRHKPHFSYFKGNLRPDPIAELDGLSRMSACERGTPHLGCSWRLAWCFWRMAHSQKRSWRLHTWDPLLPAQALDLKTCCRPTQWLYICQAAVGWGFSPVSSWTSPLSSSVSWENRTWNSEPPLLWSPRGPSWSRTPLTLVSDPLCLGERQASSQPHAILQFKVKKERNESFILCH